MNDLEKVRFERAGERDGEAVYDLFIDGMPVERGLGIDEVVRRIAERDEYEMPARAPAPFRTPERRRFETREGQT